MSLPEIPGYRIDTLIGKGACGTVYTARHDSGSLVSVKILDPKSVNADLLVNRINRLYQASPPKATVLKIGLLQLLGADVGMAHRHAVVGSSSCELAHP